MDLTIEKLERINEPYTVDVAVKENRAFTVHVDSHRILTVTTRCNNVAAAWLRQLRQCHRRKNTDVIVVGVCVDREVRFETYYRERNYQIISLCVGSQCLVYELPENGEARPEPRPLVLFFADPRVVAAGMNMKAVEEKLSRDHGISFSNKIDLRECAEEVLERSYELDLKRYDLDRLGTTVLGRNWVIDRPYRVNWYSHYYCWGPLAMDKLMYSTYDAYLCFSIGSKLIEIKREKEGAAAGNKKGVRKKKGLNSK